MGKTLETTFLIKYANWVILAVLLICYASSIQYGYVLDDHSVILKHQQVQEGIAGIPSLISHNYRFGNSEFNDGLYRPLSLVTFAIEHSISPQNASLSHAINILLFALAMLLLYQSMRLFLDAYPRFFPLLICLLFISHPIHSEVLYNIKARDEVLAFLGFAGALYFYAKAHFHSFKTGKILAVFFFILALFSKESSVSFAAIIPILLYLHPSFTRKDLYKAIALFLPFSIAFVLLHQGIIASMDNPVDPGNFGLLNNPIAASESMDLRWATTFSLQLLFIQKLAFIFPLLHDYSYALIDLINWSNWKAIGGLLIFLSLIYFAFKGVLKKQQFGLIAALYLASIILPSQFIRPIGTVFAERLLFMAVLPFSILIVFGMFHFLEKKKSTKLSNTSLAIIGLFIVFYSFSSIRRGSDWQSNYSLYQTDYQKTKKSARINYNYGSESYQMAIREGNPNVRNQLLNQAIPALQQAFKIYPAYSDAYNNLALTYAELKQYENALIATRMGKEKDPNYAKFDLLQGIFYTELKQHHQAVISYKTYLNNRPQDAEAYFLLGQALGSLNNFNEAIAVLNQSLSLNKNNPAAFNFLGMAYGLNQEPLKAVKTLEEARSLFPQNQDILYNLSLAYYQAGNSQLQRQTLQELLQINPNHAAALNNLQNI